MEFNRRQLLAGALLGVGGVGLKSMVTGLPISWFTGPLIPEVSAEETLTPQFLIFNTAGAGDPMNANCPGSYGVNGVVNNPLPEMAPTKFNLGAVETTAAAPWATLPQWALNRSAFIHHRTYQNAHPQYGKVMTLLGNAKSETGTGAEQLSAIFSAYNSQALGTIQREQVSLGGGEVTFQGRVLQSLKPRTLREMFAPLDGNRQKLQALRDQALDDINAKLRLEGTHAQRKFLERHALSRQQVRQIDDALLSRFDALDGDDEVNQVRAAVTMILMKVAPVITMHIKMGGDNHADSGLIKERDETINGVNTLKLLFDELKSLGLEDQVTVSNLHVFGRTLRDQGFKGRDHNLNHHVMMITGKYVSPGVYGKIVKLGNDYGATGIDSITGQGKDDGDIAASETLEAASKTLGRALGIDQGSLDARIIGGKPIAKALNV